MYSQRRALYVVVCAIHLVLKMSVSEFCNISLQNVVPELYSINFKMSFQNFTILILKCCLQTCTLLILKCVPRLVHYNVFSFKKLFPRLVHY